MNQPSHSPQSDKPQRLFDFKTGGWLLVVAFVICLIFGARIVIPAYQKTKTAPGDGKNPATYEFNLESEIIETDAIVTGTKRRDYIQPLIAPPVISASAMDGVFEDYRNRKGFLLPGDRVIGVTINGESRAYPLRMLNWHEVVNDTLAGEPVLVTYHPICDSAVVFDRRVDGEPAEFHVSGLLYNSNLLMYIPRPDMNEPLWSQLMMRAVTGDAAREGKRLDVLPSQVMLWADWRKRNPGTTVLEPQEEYKRLYKRDPYQSDYSTNIMRFPVKPLPPEDGRPLRERVLALESDGEWTTFFFQDIRKASGDDGLWETTFEDGPISLVYRHEDLATLSVFTPDGNNPPAVHAFWFAWHAFHGEEKAVAGR